MAGARSVRKTAATTAVAALRVYLPIEDLQPQFAAYLSTPLRARGYPPQEGEHSLIVEVAPALAIHRVADLALKAGGDLEPGILFTERQFGVLELHSADKAELQAAGDAVLAGIGAKAGDQLRPATLFTDIIEDLTDRHAIILNRTREASMILPGQSLLVYEMAPALFAAVAANEAEKAAEEITLVDLQTIGASGRVFLAGKPAALAKAQARIAATLEAVEGRSG
ncbi:MAG: microcompartment protein [Rhodospirillales bacterium]|nr:microcompartment protein [Rhodospirillales bacterium]